MIPDWTNRDPGWIHLIWAVAALTALWIVLELRGKDALARFLSPAMQARLVTRASTARTVVRLTLVAVALAACVWALMRPQTRGQDQAVMASAFSADVMVVLDVSKSMLATDVKPTRLERAKFEIAKMVKQLPGDRVGLVAFAGRAALLCPLTPDQGYFNLVLGGVDVNSVSRGGTRIGEALRVATKGFPTGPGAKLVVLITDGEDHELQWEKVLGELGKQKVTLFVVGIGALDGAPIPQRNERGEVTGWKNDQQGQIVKTRLDEQTLMRLAQETRGRYLRVDDVAAIPRLIDSIQGLERRVLGQQMNLRRIPRFHYPLALAVLLLMVEMVLTRRKIRWRKDSV